jgi:hypothetical protein
MYIVGPDAKGVMWNSITLGPDKTVLEARNTLLKYGMSRVIIAKNRKPQNRQSSCLAAPSRPASS